MPIPDVEDALARQIESRYQARHGTIASMPRLLKFQSWLIARAGGQLPETDEDSTMDSVYFDTGLDTYENDYLEGYFGND